MYCLFWPTGLAGLFGMKFMKANLRDKQSHLRTYLPAIKSATVEFHKAQCFFMLAIDIATQVVVQQGSLNDLSSTLQGLYDKYNLIGSISMSSLTPITFTMLTLHSVNMRSWYLLSLSIATVVFLAVTLYTTGRFRPSPKDMLFIRASTNATFTQCGSRDPSTYCFVSAPVWETTTDAGGDGGDTLIFTLVVTTLMILDYCGMQDISSYKSLKTWWLRQLSRVLHASNRLFNPVPAYKSQSSSSITDEQAASIYTVNLLYLIIWIGYLWAFSLFLARLVLPISASTNNVINRTWTFGQIIAITVWAMPLFEFLKFSVREC